MIAMVANYASNLQAPGSGVFKLGKPSGIK